MIILPIITSNSDSIVATSNPSAGDMGNSEILRLSSKESINESVVPLVWCINWPSEYLNTPNLQCQYRCVNSDGTRGEWSLPLSTDSELIPDDINWLHNDCSGDANYPTSISCDEIEIKCENYGLHYNNGSYDVDSSYNLDLMDLYSKNLNVDLIHPSADLDIKTTKKIEILRQHPQTILKSSVNGGVNPGGTQGFEEDSGEFMYAGVCGSDCAAEWSNILGGPLYPLVSTYMTLDASDSHIESCAYSDKSVSTKENRTYCGTDGKEFLGYLWNFELLDTDYNGSGSPCENDDDCQQGGRCYNPVNDYCQSSNPIVDCTDLTECSSWNNYCTCESLDWSDNNTCAITACWEESNGYYNCKSSPNELSVVTTNPKVQVFVSGCESLPFFDENTQTNFGTIESKVTSFILPNQYHNVDIDVQDFGSLASTFSSEGDNPSQWIWGNTEYKNTTLKPGGIIPRVRESGISKIPQVEISGGYVSNSHLGINHLGNDVYINEVEEFTLKELDFYESVNTGCRPDSAINLIEKHVNSGGTEFGELTITDFKGSGQDINYYNASHSIIYFIDSVSSCQLLPLIGTGFGDDNSNVSNEINYRQSYQQNEIVNSFAQKLFIKDGIFNKNQGLADVYVYEKSQVNDVTVAYPNQGDSQIFRYGSPYQGVSVSQYKNVELDDNVSTKNLQILSHINIPNLNSHREQLRRLKSLSVSRDSLSHPIKWYLSPVSSPDSSNINYVEDPEEYDGLQNQLSGPIGINSIIRDMGARGEYKLYWDQLAPIGKVTTTKEEVRGGDSVIINWSDSHTSGLPGSSIKQYCIQQINPWPVDVYESDWLHVHPYTWNSFDNDSQCPEHTNQDNCNSDSNCYWFANSPWLNGAGHCISSQDPASVGNLDQSILNRTIPGWRCFDWDSDGKNERAIKIPRQIESHSDDGQIYHILFKTKIIESVDTGLTDNVEEVSRYLASEPKYFSLRILPNNPSEFPNSDKLVPKEVYSHFHHLNNELTEGKPSRVFIKDIFDNKLNIGGIIESDFWLNYYQDISDAVYLPTYNAGELYPTIPNFKITDSYWKSANNTGDYFVSFGNPTDGIGGIVSSLGDTNANPDNLPTSAQAAFLVYVGHGQNYNLHTNNQYSDDLIVVYFKDGQFYWDDNSPSFSQFIPTPYDFIIARLDVDQGIRTYSNSDSGLSNLDYINPNLYDWMENFLQTAEGCHKSIKSIGKWDSSYFEDIIQEYGFDSSNWISNESGGWDFFLMPHFPRLYSLPRDDWSFTKLDNNCMLSNPSKGCCYIDVEYEFLQQLDGGDGGDGGDDPPELIYGCTDESSCNFNPQANASDNSCDYSCFGCTDSEALNYSSLATIDDGSCTYAPVVGCMDASAENYNPLAVEPCENCCDYRGCQNEWAGNYDPQANIGSDQTECVFMRDCVDFSDSNTCEDGVFQHYCKWNPNTNECMCRASYAGDGGRNCNLIHPDHPLGIGNCETIGGAYSYGTQGCMECWTLQMLDDWANVISIPNATSCHSVSECDIYTGCYNPNGPGYSEYCCREAEDFEDYTGDWIPPEGVDDTTGGTSSQCPPGMTLCPPTSGGYTCHSCHCENGQNYTSGPTCVNGSYSDCSNPSKLFYPISNCDINGCTGSPCGGYNNCGNSHVEQCEKMLQCVKEYYNECGY